MNRLDEFKEVIKRRERKKKTVFIFSMTLALTLGLYLFFASPFANTSQVFISDNFKIPSHSKKVPSPKKELMLLGKSENSPSDSLSENMDSRESSISGTEIELKLFPYQGSDEEKKDSKPYQNEEVDTIQNNPPVLEEIENDTSQKPRDSVEKMPSFIGGNNELETFLKKELQYPPEAQEQKIEGKVIVQFVINQ